MKNQVAEENLGNLIFVKFNERQLNYLLLRTLYILLSSARAGDDAAWGREPGLKPDTFGFTAGLHPFNCGG